MSESFFLVRKKKEFKHGIRSLNLKSNSSAHPKTSNGAKNGQYTRTSVQSALKIPKKGHNFGIAALFDGRG